MVLNGIEYPKPRVCCIPGEQNHLNAPRALEDFVQVEKSFDQRKGVPRGKRLILTGSLIICIGTDPVFTEHVIAFFKIEECATGDTNDQLSRLQMLLVNLTALLEFCMFAECNTNGN